MDNTDGGIPREQLRELRKNYVEICNSTIWRKEISVEDPQWSCKIPKRLTMALKPHWRFWVLNVFSFLAIFSKLNKFFSSFILIWIYETMILKQSLLTFNSWTVLTLFLLELKRNRSKSLSMWLTTWYNRSW